MTEARLRTLLRDAPVPDQSRAEERGWRVVQAAFEQRRPAPAPRRARRLAIAVAIGLLALAIGLSPAGARVADLFKDVTGIGEENARPALTSLPAPGRLLVGSARGPWIVSGDGSKRLLGDYRDATWSPHGLYVAATAGRALTALTPTGVVRWSLASGRRVSDPAWSPSGYRIAYRSGRSLRVVAGDGTDDHPLTRGVGAGDFAWKPLTAAGAERLAKGFGAQPLAYADRAGRIHLVDADTGRAFWVSAAGSQPHELLWTPAGDELLSVGRAEVRILDQFGSPVRTLRLRPGTRERAAAISPSGKLLALAETRVAPSAPPRSELDIVNVPGGQLPKRPLFADPGQFTGVSWSPNGHWLLLAWRDADQWLFIPAGGGRVHAVANIGHQFAPGASGPAAFPRLEGWCCTATGTG
jgi:WD40-like Beta Propeller Repeat